MEAIRIVEAGDLKKDRGGFRPGDTVKVMVKVVEGEKERQIQVMKRATVRRSKLYYLRELVGKAARLKEKRIAQVPTSGES